MLDAQSMTSTNEGPYASSDLYNTNQSSFNAPETKQEENNKTKASSSNSAKAAAARAQQSAAGGTGWLGGFFNKFKPKTQMKLPDDTNPTVCSGISNMNDGLHSLLHVFNMKDCLGP